MGILKDALRNAKLFSAGQRKQQEFLYEIVSEEIISGDIKLGLWTQALVEAEGDEKRAKTKYIKLRVQSLMDETRVAKEKARVAKENEARRRANEDPYLKKRRELGYDD